MTDNNPEVETLVEAPSQENHSGNREARYRTQRNQAREALEIANQRLEAYQRAEVERLASELSEPTDVFTLSGKELADFLGESGDIDSEAVAEAVAGILATRPGLSKPARPVDPTQGMGNNHAGSPRWVDLLS